MINNNQVIYNWTVVAELTSEDEGNNCEKRFCCEVKSLPHSGLRSEFWPASSLVILGNLVSFLYPGFSPKKNGKKNS